nr:hypothetical protein [Morchella crassipes]
MNWCTKLGKGAKEGSLRKRNKPEKRGTLTPSLSKPHGMTELVPGNRWLRDRKTPVVLLIKKNKTEKPKKCQKQNTIQMLAYVSVEGIAAGQHHRCQKIKLWKPNEWRKV